MKITDELKTVTERVTGTICVLENIIKGLSSPCSVCSNHSTECRDKGCLPSSCVNFVLCEVERK